MKYRYYQPKPNEYGRTIIGPGERVSKWEPGYHLVYNSELHTPKTDAEAVLEEIFFLHNRDNRPRRFEIRSMCVGDVVVLEGHGAWLCDVVGWTKIDPDLIPEGVKL